MTNNLLTCNSQKASQKLPKYKEIYLHFTFSLSMSHVPQDQTKVVAAPTVLPATQGPGLRRMHGMA